LYIDHLDRRHLVEHRPRCQARCQRSQPLLQRDLQAVGQERHKDVRLDKVKLIEQDDELYVLARSGARRDKEQAMRRRRLKKLIKRLHKLRQQKLTRDQLLIKLGAARKEPGPAAWRIIELQLPYKEQAVTPDTFGFKLNWQKLREARRREGSYLLRSNVTGGDPAQLWAFYLQLVEVEQAFERCREHRSTVCPGSPAPAGQGVRVACPPDTGSAASDARISGMPRSITQVRLALPYCASIRSMKSRSVVLSEVLPAITS
jgi:hypothetical protein